MGQRTTVILLEDEPFLVISYLVLADSDYYESVKKRLCNRFPPEGNVIGWQQRLRSRSKERLEVLEDLAMFCYRTFFITFVEKHVIKLFYLPLISPRPLSYARACMQCLQSVIYNRPFPLRTPDVTSLINVYLTQFVKYVD